MSQKPASLREDYLKLLQDSTSLEQMGLVHDSSRIQPTQPLVGKDMKRALTQLRLESMLVATMDKDKPLELSSDTQQRLIDAAGNQQVVLDEYEKELLVAIERLELRFPVPYLVGDFPLAYPFNAVTVLRNAGALVLVNRGLTDMIWFAAKLFSAGVSVQVTDGTDEGDNVDPMPFTKEQIAEWLAQVVLSYLRNKDAQAAGHLLPQFGRVRSMVVACLTNECTKFVIAHEFAHIIKGHLAENFRVDSGDDDVIFRVLEQVLKSFEQTSGVVRYTSRKTQEIAGKWRQEIDADLLGLRILFAGQASRGSNKRFIIDGNHPLFEFTAAAPFFLFALYHLITEVKKASTGHRQAIFLTEHPPAELRHEFVKMTYGSWGQPELPHIANEVMKWFSGVQQSVVERTLKQTT